EGRGDGEGIAEGGGGGEVGRLEHGAPVALEAAGQIANTHAEQHSRVERACGRDPSSQHAPVLDAPAFDVARPEDEVGASSGLEKPGYVGRVVGEVAVHGDDKLGAVRQRAVEACDVRRAESLLARPVKDVDVVELRGEPVG